MLATNRPPMKSPLDVFEEFESNVRSYIRSFPTVFATAKGSRVQDVHGRSYIDFFAGAGALNYGHNPEPLKKRLLEYIAANGIAHSLDMGTKVKAEFLERFQSVILSPRGLEFRVMFPGPTGTNAVESALKLARKVTGRTTVVSFTNAFHGMTLGSLAVTGNRMKRSGAGVPLHDTCILPYDGYIDGVDSADYARRLLLDQGSGVAQPAAIIVETVQGEGGLHSASNTWLQKLEQTCREIGALLIVDDIQAGCGRTGPFFSFERAGIHPDIICLSKSISGYGLPMALTLIRPDLDAWAPGEHNGTFRGNNLAFVTAHAALAFWEDNHLESATEAKSHQMRRRLAHWVEAYPGLQGEVRGQGMMLGLACGVEGMAKRLSHAAFRRGLLAETSGPNDEVLKLLPPITTDLDTLDAGMDIIEASIEECLKVPAPSASGSPTA
jgi:diaminobutyrate-2-oxoglutarate transaminase